MRTIIAGSRGITDYSLVAEAIKESGFEITEVTCGMARGVDLLGLQWAATHRVPVARFPADWDTHGKSAGFIRNAKMADNADALIAITTGTPGTRNMIRLAHQIGLKVFVKEIR